MLKLDVGELIFIIIFCSTYAIVANVQSRIVPIEDSMATEVRQKVDEKLGRIQMSSEKAHCLKLAGNMKSYSTAVVWYHNLEEGEYWCGYLNLNTLTTERFNELDGHFEILNRPKILEVQNEDNQR